MRNTVIATVAVLALAGPAWAAEEDQGNGKGTETAPGQAKPEGSPAQGHAKGQDETKTSNPAAPASSPKSKRKSAKRNNGNHYGQRKAAKPKGTPAPGAPKSSNGKAHQKTTICHATGSATNPYVTITISNAALEAHDRHQDGRDIIPAPAGGCPETAGTTAPAASGENKPAIAPRKGSTRLRTAGGHTAPSKASLRSAAPSDGTGAVLGESANAPAVNPAAAPEVVADRESGADTATRTATASLPFTGMDAWLLSAAGLAFLLGGFALRRAAATR